MAAGPTISGTEGKMLATPSGGSETELEIGKWSFNAEADTDRYASSKSGGYKKTKAGNKAATGAFEGKRVSDAGKVETVLTGVVVGTAGSMKLHFDATTYILMPYVIKTISYEVDVNAGTIESFAGTFESDGAWSYV